MKNLRMSFWDHIGILRNALLRCLLVITITTLVTFSFSEHFIEFLEAPLLKILPKEVKGLYFTSITDKFFIYLKTSLFVAIIISLPYLLYELWRFVSPGLYEKERKVALPFIFGGVIAFAVGISFGYLIVLPYGYKFLIEFGGTNDIPIITIKEYFNLTLSLLLILGIIFELPLVMGILAKIGVITPLFLTSHRKHAFLLIVLLSAIVTPTTDIINMFIFMVPLFFLYEIGVIFVKVIHKKTSTQKVCESY